MNEKVQQLLTGIGALIELWGVVYNGFLGRGFDKKEAIDHTAAFMKMIVESSMAGNADGGQKE